VDGRQKVNAKKVVQVNPSHSKCCCGNVARHAVAMSPDRWRQWQAIERQPQLTGHFQQDDLGRQCNKTRNIYRFGNLANVKRQSQLGQPQSQGNLSSVNQRHKAISAEANHSHKAILARSTNATRQSQPAGPTNVTKATRSHKKKSG
jgi:hypothetical protein